MKNYFDQFDKAQANPFDQYDASGQPAETAAQAGQRYRDVFGGGARKQGAELPSPLQGFMSALEAPTFGFADEIAGAGAAVGGLMHGDTNLADNYRQGRDMYRGASQAAHDQNPWLTAGTQMAVSAPLMGAGAPAAIPADASRLAIAAARARAAATPALAYGAAHGAGASEADTIGGVAKDAAAGGLTSAGLAGLSQPIAMGMGSAGRTIMARIRESDALDYARQKVGEALLRDARGNAVQGVADNTLGQVEARLGKLGNDATLADASGQNTRALLDTVATLPGRTKDAVEQLIRRRQAGRGVRLGNAADEALGVTGSFAEDVPAYIAQREMDSAPLYAKAYAEAPPIIIPKDILLRDSVTTAYRKAQQLAAEKGVSLPNINPNAVQPIPPLSLQQADFLKRAMDDVLYLSKVPTSNVGKNQFRLMQDTRRALVSAIDDQAGPAYAKARAAFEGPTRAIEAADMGRNILREDTLAIPSMIKGLSPSEQEAFRLGAAQAIREKAGTMGGQSQLLRMWRDNATADKLKAVFGNDFRKFQAAVMREERKKAMESVGRGSQTASREQGLNDLDMSPVMEAGAAAANAAKGNPGPVMGWLMQHAQRVQTPERVRDEMGRLLMLPAPEARNALRDLAGQAEAVNAARQARADASGRFVGLFAPQPDLLIQPQR